VRAWALGASPGDYALEDLELPALGEGQVRVEVVASALNHMDLWLRRGLPKPRCLPHVPGCDGAGRVAEVGRGVTAWRKGDEVVVNPSLACGRCSSCLGGKSVQCDRWGILGEHTWGTHASSVIVGEANLVRRPAGLGWEPAAAYGLCGLTAYRMLRRARLVAGEKLLVVGVGGGVASAAMALGQKFGAEVYVTSRTEAKRSRAMALGAAGAFPSGQPLPLQVDVVVDSAGEPTWRASMSSLRPGGRLVVCGGTGGGSVELKLARLFLGQLEVIGSTMGTFGEFDELSALVGSGLPVQVDSSYPFDEYLVALERLGSSMQFGKVVLVHDGP